jgi:hypothetical protein
MGDLTCCIHRIVESMKNSAYSFDNINIIFEIGLSLKIGQMQ